MNDDWSGDTGAEDIATIDILDKESSSGVCGHHRACTVVLKTLDRAQLSYLQRGRGVLEVSVAA